VHIASGACADRDFGTAAQTGCHDRAGGSDGRTCRGDPDTDRVHGREAR
jgi:hypothetical protein